MVHLANYKRSDSSFLAQFTQVYTAESGTRCPDMREAEAADKKLHDEIYRLVNEEGWSLDEALHAMSEVRSDVAILPQPISSGLVSFGCPRV